LISIHINAKKPGSDFAVGLTDYDKVSSSQRRDFDNKTVF